MKQKRIFPAVLLALFPAVFILAVQGHSPGDDRNLRASKIIGVVLDRNDARIADATVRIENAQFSREVYTSDEGAFEVELPAGTYRITVEAQGFRAVEVVSFHVRADKSESLKVRMKVKPPKSTLKIE